ncbi:MAG: hypothetical protein HOY71_56875, partial [Nonomuraea sp.]|nr:hypothetical protein [Nonomuraea sp.]
LWCVPLAVVAALDDGHARSLALGAVFALPYALVWWYAARRRLRPGHWAADAVAILILGGWSAMVVGASVDMSGPSHLWITPPALLVLAGLGWTAAGAWLLRLLRDLRP